MIEWSFVVARREICNRLSFASQRHFVKAGHRSGISLLKVLGLAAASLSSVRNTNADLHRRHPGASNPARSQGTGRQTVVIAAQRKIIFNHCNPTPVGTPRAQARHERFLEA